MPLYTTYHNLYVACQMKGTNYFPSPPPKKLLACKAGTTERMVGGSFIEEVMESATENEQVVGGPRQRALSGVGKKA